MHKKNILRLKDLIYKSKDCYLPCDHEVLTSKKIPGVFHIQVIVSGTGAVC